MKRKIIIKPLSKKPMEEHEVEMCEHKGIGHPDTIADAVCEAASRELSLTYREAYGHILHHNLDKGLVAAGRSAPRFGGGSAIEPIKIIICGRATNSDPKLDINTIAIAATRRSLEENLRCDLKQFKIETEIKEGAPI
jgi:S-adenosylmethionine synthetase